ncbi:hypothetical protein [Pseudanabaena sp. ABRG5-3]|uniref:hypothetical protein n=1 Tax=Pseudanabaena sp. ABRG5-3 TaxID=685565 RepID=UPI000DC6DE39|nr:hypothetical protein [Pseudanabaena sp. ABRG5-3]BBC26923.1 hypothetical protein ABRG53_c084 [Pseudanabaena sp. ABRG5-3]
MMLQTKARSRSPNNYAIELKIYTENSNQSFQSGTILTVVDTFASRPEAKNAILELQRQGIQSSQIVVITQSYQEHDNSINWEYVATDDNLIEVLTGLGIDVHDALKFENQVKLGSFLVAAIVTGHSASQSQYLLKNIGRKVISVY